MEEEGSQAAAGSQIDGSNAEQDYGEMEDSAAEDDIFKNNHDLIGVEGILRAQKNEIEKKKVRSYILLISCSWNSECKTSDISERIRKSMACFSFSSPKSWMTDPKMFWSMRVPFLTQRV